MGHFNRLIRKKRRKKHSKKLMKFNTLYIVSLLLFKQNFPACFFCLSERPVAVVQIGFGFSLPLPRRCQSDEVMAHESWSLFDVGMERDRLENLWLILSHIYKQWIVWLLLAINDIQIFISGCIYSFLNHDEVCYDVLRLYSIPHVHVVATRFPTSAIHATPKSFPENL